jgi:hypothetical protein
MLDCLGGIVSREMEAKVTQSGRVWHAENVYAPVAWMNDSS